MRFNEFYEKWEPYGAEMKSWKKTKYIWTGFLGLWGCRPLEAISTELIDRWRLSRLHQVTHASVDREFNSLCGFFGKAVEWGYLPVSPCAPLKRFHRFTHRSRVLSQNEALKLLGAASKKSPGCFWAVTVLHDSGARPGELMSLSWRDVDFKKREISLKNTKTRRDRKIYMSDAILTATTAMPRVSGRALVCEPWPRPDLRAVVAVLDDFKLYDLRKNFISRALSAGCNIKAVSELVGSSPTTILKYYASVPESELRDVSHRATNYIRKFEQLSLLTL